MSLPERFLSVADKAIAMTTFRQYLRSRIGDGTNVGDLAADVFSDSRWTRKNFTMHDILADIPAHRGCKEARQAARRAWFDWLKLKDGAVDELPPRA